MIYRLLQALVVLTFVLLFAGGLVTSTDSGLAVPDWPLSFGSFSPPMIGGIRFEHTHRIIAASVGFLTLILTIWIGKTEPRAWVRRLAIAALGAVVLQGILGGMTVLHKLPAPVSIAHACLGPIFFSMVTALTVITNHPKGPRLEGSGDAKRVSDIAVFVVFVQILLGAVVRHTGQAVWVHVAWAFVVLAVIGLVLVRRWSRTVLFLGLLAVLEFFLGIGTFVFTRVEGLQSQTASILFPTIHQTLGALMLATSVVIRLKSKQ